MIIENRFSLGDFVYIKTDTDQYARIVVGINVRPSALTYVIQQNLTTSEHYDIELSLDKDEVIKVL